MAYGENRDQIFSCPDRLCHHEEIDYAYYGAFVLLVAVSFLLTYHDQGMSIERVYAVTVMSYDWVMFYGEVFFVVECVVVTAFGWEDAADFDSCDFLVEHTFVCHEHRHDYRPYLEGSFDYWNDNPGFGPSGMAGGQGYDFYHD